MFNLVDGDHHLVCFPHSHLENIFRKKVPTHLSVNSIYIYEKVSGSELKREMSARTELNMTDYLNWILI